MQRVMIVKSGATMSPKVQKRLSVGFGANASVQIHKTATLTDMQQQTTTTRADAPSYELPNASDDAITPGRRKSLHENLLMRLLSTPSEEPLFRKSSSENGESQRTADDSFDSCLSGRSSSFDFDMLGNSPDILRCNTPPAAENATPVPNRRMQLLMRDFNSPSAAARLRAVRALNSVSKRNAYGNFDVSYAEQDIITAEERHEQDMRTIQDVMRDVCVYVEVRSGTDNRSDGIKEHIASLGAKVNERLLKDTTHVIFKDGLLSTYQKAKKMNVPIVSILWVEACKRHVCLMNPVDFKISNLERYENPDLFKRIRRQKSMQPGAVDANGPKKRPVAGGKAPVLSPPSKLPVLHRIRKDDRLERILSDFEAENQITSSNEGPIDEYDQLLQAAPMRMLERFRSTPTPMDRDEEIPGTATPLGEQDAGPTSVEKDLASTSKRALFTNPDSASKRQRTSPGLVASRARRKTVMFTPQMTNVEEETVTTDVPSANEETPKSTLGRNRRKTIVVENEVASLTPQLVVGKATRRRKTIVELPVNESNTSVAASPSIMTRTRRRLTNSNTDKENSIVSEAHTSPGGKDLKSVANTLANDMSVMHLSASAKRRSSIKPAQEIGTPVSFPNTVQKAAPSQRRRRKTIAFGNEENTPPTAVSMDVTNYHPLKERRITQQGSTICSVKDMDVSSTTMQAASRDEVAKLSSYGTTMNVSGASSSVSAGTLHRRTLFIPSVEGAMDARNSAGMTSCHEVSSIMSERQRTFCTPGNSTPIDPLEVSETPPDMSGVETRSHLTHADGSSIANRPNPVSSSTPQSLVSNGGDRRKTLLEQYNDTLTFSSTRAPNIRRRTVFDITMDIMDHRLSEINRQAAAARAEGQQTPARNTAAPATQQQDNPGLQSPPPLAVQTSLDTYYRKSAKSCEKSATSSVAIEAPKKRKLFNIQPTGTDSPIAEVRQIAAVTPKTASKRRSLAPVVAEGSKSITASAKKRRTTGIFESPAQQRVQGSSKSLFPIGRGLPTMVSQRPQPRQYLATTNLHSEQNAFVQEAIASLNGFLVEPNVTDNTTHLVTLETRRTINLLRALIRGLWIVRYEWIVDSYRAGCWLPEESFELRDFSVAVQINRSERQAFGSCYRNELFGDYGPFWVSPGCTVPELQLRELVLLCRGKITRNRTQARFIVVEPNDPALDDVDGAPNEQLYVTPLWILDSITINRVKKLSRKYRLR